MKRLKVGALFLAIPSELCGLVLFLSEKQGLGGCFVPMASKQLWGQAIDVDWRAAPDHLLLMPRSTRIEFPHAFYHVMARGNRRAHIFVQESDHPLFLRTLGEACARTGWRVHAWVLMSNHYHLVIETPSANLVAGMQWLQNTYTRRFNTRHREWGRLFGDRYKAIPVEGGGFHYETLLDYLHLNPIRAGLVKVTAGGSLLDYPWSSVAGGYALPPARRPGWLAAAGGFAVFGQADTAAGRRAWVARLDRRALEEVASDCGVPPLATEDRRRSHLRRGWYWGSQAFAEKLLHLRGNAKRSTGRARTSQEDRAHDEQEAERLLRAGLAEVSLTEELCGVLPGSDPRKVRVAATIWAQTTVSQKWIAERLSMRSAGNVAQQIHRHNRFSRD